MSLTPAEIYGGLGAVGLVAGTLGGVAVKIWGGARCAIRHKDILDQIKELDRLRQSADLVRAGDAVRMATIERDLKEIKQLQRDILKAIAGHNRDGDSGPETLV